MSDMGIFRQLSFGNYNSTVVRRAKAELPSLQPLRGFGMLRERDSGDWFRVEFLTYHDDRNKLRSFAYVRREDGVEIADGHYIFQDELGGTEFQMEEVEGQLAVRMALSPRLTKIIGAIFQYLSNSAMPFAPYLLQMPMTALVLAH